MKYQLKGIIDAEFTTLGKARPSYIQPLVERGCKELAAEMAEEPGYAINGNGRFYKSDVIGPYLRPADTPVDRMIVELEELSERYGKLSAFLETDKFLELGNEMCELIRRQHKAMSEYKDILEKRIELVQSESN